MPLPFTSQGRALLGGASIGNQYGGDRLRENSRYTTGATGLRTGHFKLEAEAPFSQVRVWVGNKYGSNSGNAQGRWKAIVGATDTMAINTVDNAFTPTVAGVANNAVVSSGNGWRAVTWDSGAADKICPRASGTNNSNTAGYMHSDWINLPSLARADVAGGRPAALLRVAQADVSAEITVSTDSSALYYGARGGGSSWYREFLCQFASGDAVTTIANKAASVDASGGFEPYAWLEFKYTKRARSVLSIGNSRMGSSFSTYLLDNWPAVALRGLSTQTAPIATVNIANSGCTQTQALGHLDTMLAAGVTFTDAIIQGWNLNGFVQTDVGANAAIAEMLGYITSLRTAGVKIFMTTDYGANGYNGTAELARVKVVNQVKTWGAQGLVTDVDTDAIITDYTTPTAGIITAAYDSGDHVHANAAGQRAMSDALKAVWS